MNNWHRSSEWSVSTRLLIVTVVPIAVLFIAMATWIYTSESIRAIQSVHRNGDLLATALAQTSQFATLNTDTEALQRSTQRMLAARTDILAIEILDEHYKQIAVAGQPHPDRAFTFEKPIYDDKLDIDLFEGNAPHTSSVDNQSLPLQPGYVIGHVRVQMSAEPILKEERTRLLLAGAVLLFAAIFCIPIGLHLARKSIRVPLDELTRALKAVRLGNFDIHFAAKTGGEIGELQIAFEEMATDLHCATEQLQEEVRHRTKDLDAALRELMSSNDERKRLIAHTTDLVEEERRRIARELHDQFNSSLLSIRFKTEPLLGVKEKDLSIENIHKTASFIIEEIERLYDDARAMLKRLRPEALDTLGLAGAIKAAVRTFNESQDDCWLDLDAAPDGLPPLSPKVSIAAYRVVQEALANILKHSRATSSSVSYRLTPDASKVILVVTDNGSGFQADQRFTGFGLLGIKERVESIGGSLTVESTPGQGTRLTFFLPAEAAVDDSICS